MKGARLVKEIIETQIVYVCHLEGQRARQSAFELDMVVGAMQTSLCQELQRCWVFHAQQFRVCIKSGPLSEGHQTNLTQLWKAL